VPVPEETFAHSCGGAHWVIHAIFWVLWCKEKITGRYTDNRAVCHLIWPISAPTSIIPTIFMPDALPTTTLPIYPGLGWVAHPMAWLPGEFVQVHLEDGRKNEER